MKSPSDAEMPVLYSEAKATLAKCDSLDEIKQWMNKSAALAFYGRQMKDEELFVRAQRFRSRSTQRCGQILISMEAAKPGPKNNGKTPVNNSVGAPLPNRPVTQSRTELAKAVGLSKTQQMQAVAVARVPERTFEKMVEAKKPATIEQLAALGARKIGIPEDYLQGRDPKDYQAGTYGRGNLRHFVEDTCQTYSAKQIARGSVHRDVTRVMSDIQKVRKWLDELESEFGKVKP